MDTSQFTDPFYTAEFQQLETHGLSNRKTPLGHVLQPLTSTEYCPDT